MRVFSGHRAPVRCLAYSPDGRVLASGSEDRTARLWDVATGQRAVLRDHRGYVRALAFSADGKTLASGDSAGEWASLWDVRFGDRIRTAHVGMGEVVCLAFTPDGEGLLAAGHEGWGWAAGRVILVRLSDYQRVGLRAGAGQGLAVSPGGKVLASGADDRTVHVWPAPGESGDERRLAGHKQEIRALAFRPDGLVLVSAAAGELKRWDVVTGKDLPAAHPPPADALPLALSADAALLATGGEDGVVRVWETATGRQVAAFDWGFGPVYAAAFAPDGMTAAAAGRDFRVVVWDLDLEG